MKAVILAGGLGTRLSEETQLKPKPMVEIGGKPILWHIMKIYSHFGINDFVICCGYRGVTIKEYFSNYFLHNSDVTFDMSRQTTEIHQNTSEPWRVTLVDTGEHTQTGGRLKRVRHYLGDQPFCLTYGDGLSDVNIPSVIEHHMRHSALVTVTAVQPPGRFGSLDISDNHNVQAFVEKPKGDGGWINGGFFVMEPTLIDLIDGDATTLEAHTLQEVVKLGKLSAYKHYGFWHAMDTRRDCDQLSSQWNSGQAPWKVWDRPTNAHSEVSRSASALSMTSFAP